MSGRFEGKVAFVTGGASGLGAAAAQRFSDEGAQVAVADIDAAGAEKVAASLRDGYAVQLDAGDARSVARAVADAVEHYGRLDVVFNNAGITGPQQILHELEVEDWDRVRAVNGDGISSPPAVRTKSRQNKSAGRGRRPRASGARAH